MMSVEVVFLLVLGWSTAGFFAGVCAGICVGVNLK